MYLINADEVTKDEKSFRTSFLPKIDPETRKIEEIVCLAPSAFEGMTNDEVLSAVFPNGMQIFSKEWRNSPYKEVSE